MKKPSKTHCIHENISLMRDRTKYFYPIHPYIYISIVGVVYINREIPIPMDCHFFLIVYGHHQFPISIRHIFLGDQNPNFRPTSIWKSTDGSCAECFAQTLLCDWRLCFRCARSMRSFKRRWVSNNAVNEPSQNGDLTTKNGGWTIKPLDLLGFIADLW